MHTGATGAWEEVAGNFSAQARSPVESDCASVAALSEDVWATETGSRVSSHPAIPGSSRRGALCLWSPESPPLLLFESASNDKTRGVNSVSKALSCAVAAPSFWTDVETLTSADGAEKAFGFCRWKKLWSRGLFLNGDET